MLESKQIKSANYKRPEVLRSLSYMYEDIADMAIVIDKSKTVQRRHILEALSENPQRISDVINNPKFFQALGNLGTKNYLKRNTDFKDFLEALKIFADGLSAEYIRFLTPQDSNQVVAELQDFVKVFDWLDNVIILANNQSHKVAEGSKEQNELIQIEDEANKARNLIAKPIQAIIKLIKKPLLELVRFGFATGSTAEKEAYADLKTAKSKTLKFLGLNQTDINQLKKILNSPDPEHIYDKSSRPVKILYDDFRHAINESYETGLKVLNEGIEKFSRTRKTAYTKELANLITHHRIFKGMTTAQYLIDMSNDSNRKSLEGIIKKFSELGVDFNVFSRDHKTVLHYLKPDHMELAQFFKDGEFGLSFDELSMEGLTPIQYMNRQRAFA
jgi:hypothetical protein